MRAHRRGMPGHRRGMPGAAENGKRTGPTTGEPCPGLWDPRTDGSRPSPREVDVADGLAPEDLRSEFAEDDLADDADFLTGGLDSSNTVHDQYQFESKFNFAIDPPATGETHRSYQVDVYFFLPRSMGINSDSFPRDRFYASLTHYLRVRTPHASVDDSLDAATWTLPSADRYLEMHLETARRQRLAERVIQDVKLFGCRIYTLFKRMKTDLRNAFRRRDMAGREETVTRVSHVLDNVQHVVDCYRARYIFPLKSEELLIDDEVRRAFLLVDEYISYRLEWGLIELLRVLAHTGTQYGSFVLALTGRLDDEIRYRHAHQIVSLEGRGDLEADQSEAALRETHYYRLGLLKKYVSEVLYLQTSASRKNGFYKNAVAGIGAALAATWATLAQLQTAQMVTPDQQADQPLRLLLVIVLGVVAYVFKDRIKELSREYFNERFKHRIPDFEVTMHYPHVDETGVLCREFVGRSREYLHYLQKEDLSPEIAFMRDVGHRAEAEPERMEQIMHYSRLIRLQAETFRDRFPEIQFLHDVMRFDVSEFLNKLSNPDRTLSYYEPDRGVVTVEAPKVYHLNVVFRYAVLSGDQEERPAPRQVDFERIRIVLNKQGIVRIEEVVPRGEIGYSEEP